MEPHTWLRNRWKTHDAIGYFSITASTSGSWRVCKQLAVKQWALHDPATKLLWYTVVTLLFENDKDRWTRPLLRAPPTAISNCCQVQKGCFVWPKRAVRQQKEITRKKWPRHSWQIPLASSAEDLRQGPGSGFWFSWCDYETVAGHDRYSGDEIKICGRMKFAKYGLWKTNRRPAQLPPVLFPVKAHRHACSW